LILIRKDRTPGRRAIRQAKYLADLGIAVDDVRQARLTSLGIRGTPTLLLVNKDGVVRSSWVGRLRPEKELEVMARL
jgi:hypothetical protein